MPRTTLLKALCPFTLCLLAAATARVAAEPPARPVDYNHDVKPLLAARCYACHGPDEGKRKGKFRLDVKEEALKKAIKPGDAAGSALVKRITSEDVDKVMPPPDAKGDPLTPAQIDLLRRWIDQGAKFDLPWAYVKPTRPALPEVKNQAWVQNPIDAFIAAGHERQGFRPAAEADRVTLIRRLSFDLTGLPPAPADVDAFVKDPGNDAYEKLVDRLLASPHYGERMASYWLDLVRYADTAGYHSDNHRDVWLFRDFVIDAFNSNKRFDQFTIEQLAGDLLPNPTRDQRIASGYNRLLQTTEEGGAQPKEYTAKYAADRVRNASVVWLAATMGCCECHNHKFDPFTTKDFYSFEAFFADVKETAVGRQEQTPMPTKEQEAELRKLDEAIAGVKAILDKQTPELEVAQAEWEKTALAELADNKAWYKPPVPAKGLVADAAAALAVEPAKRTPQQKLAVSAYFRTVTPLLKEPRDQLAKLENDKKQLIQKVPTTLVSTAVSPRTVRVLPRGNWLDDSGEVVTPNVPAFLPPVDVTGRRATRLDLANWLVSRDNPLVARVFVNRLWKVMFGQGLVKSLDDFGTQGALPSHPELLDWLAVEFVDSGWDVKHLLKLMALSNTYRQSSAASKEQQERDSRNIWLARQNRFRLDAEMVHDNALAVSGLLSPKGGGPSVKPYQPAGYWSYLNFPKRDWVNDKGDGLYRRGLYTYWCRTFLHPSIAAFDAPTREECTVERPRSSTPLQSLVLLNDPIYVEAARVFAERIVKEGGNATADRTGWAYRRALSRDPKAEEHIVLVTLYEKHLAEYSKDKDAAQKLVGTGERPVPKDVDVAELAAWTSVARVLLNLHETVTRP
jgi:Protein of unknown function (DUF1553)/Protein of unknown function (DUF1549)/Planctomycete cytochrome C